MKDYTMGGRLTAFAVAIVVAAICIWLTGCEDDPSLNNYQTATAIEACQKQGGFVGIVSTKEVRCEKPESSIATK